jgi:hypothetical protein
MWSDYGAPRRKHWRGRSRRSSRSSIGPWILAAAVVVVAGVIGISGMYPQIIDPEWVRGTSPHSQRVSETAPESVGMTHPDPFASPPGAIAAIASLGDDRLKPHDEPQSSSPARLGWVAQLIGDSSETAVATSLLFFERQSNQVQHPSGFAFASNLTHAKTPTPCAPN